MLNIGGKVIIKDKPENVWTIIANDSMPEGGGVSMKEGCYGLTRESELGTHGVQLHGDDLKLAD